MDGSRSCTQPAPSSHAGDTRRRAAEREMLPTRTVARGDPTGWLAGDCRGSRPDCAGGRARRSPMESEARLAILDGGLRSRPCSSSSSTATASCAASTSRGPTKRSRSSTTVSTGAAVMTRCAATVGARQHYWTSAGWSSPSCSRMWRYRAWEFVGRYQRTTSARSRGVSNLREIVIMPLRVA